MTGFVKIIARQIIGKSAGVVILLVASKVLYGCEILDPSQLQASYTLASNTLGVLWVVGNYDDGVDPPRHYYFSGFVIGMEKDLSGNVLKTYIAIPNHTWNLPGATVLYAGSGNVNAQNGIVLTNLQPEYVSPLWNSSNPWNNAGDIAIYSSKTPVPDSWIHQLAPLNSMSAFYNFDYYDLSTIATSTGYGPPSTPNGTLTPTGDPMTFAGSLDTFVASNVELGGNYIGIEESPYNEPALNGAATGGDSGSIVLNASNQIIGMAVSAIGGPTDQERETYFDNFTAPDYYNQVAPYAGIIIEQPILNLQKSGTNLVLSWTGNYILQTSTNLPGGFLDLMNATSPYTNAMTAPQSFFRLRSAP